MRAVGWILAWMLLAPPALVAATLSGASGSGISVQSSSGGGPVASCTYGVDCLCDTLGGRGTTCFDFEEPGLYDPSLSDGPIAYGTVDGLPDRGGASRFVLDYGIGDIKTLYRSTDGSYPTGADCPWPANTPYEGCTGTKEYASAAQCALGGLGPDCFGENDVACMDIQRSGDYDEEIGTLTLTGGTGVTADIGGGNQHMGQRVPAGLGNTCGFLGATNTFTNSTQLGVTMKMALSSNTDASGVFATYLKFDQWGNGSSGYATEYWFVGRSDNGYTGADVLPFRPFMFVDPNGGLQANCEAIVAGATIVVGETGVGVVCNSAFNSIYFAADPAVYNQPTDWPFGTWGCVQAEISGMGTSNVTIKTWLNGTLIMHITNIDGTKLFNKSYSFFHFDNYSNENNPTDGDGLEQSFVRYEDDIVINPGGAPVSCATIGM